MSPGWANRRPEAGRGQARGCRWSPPPTPRTEAFPGARPRLRWGGRLRRLRTLSPPAASPRLRRRGGGDERDRLGGPPAVRDRKDVDYVEVVESRPLAPGPLDGGRLIHQHPVEIEQQRVAPEPIHFRYSSPSISRARFAIVLTGSTNQCARFGGVPLAALSQSAEMLTSYEPEGLVTSFP